MSAVFDAKMYSNGLIKSQKKPGVFHMYRREHRHQLSDDNLVEGLST
jgi:hypothetical protein